MKLQKILKSRKGFTLMELIIVLVIVAILAAALIPSFLNFATRAREESLYAQARVGMVAAQVLITESGGPVDIELKNDFQNLGSFLAALDNKPDAKRFTDLIKDDVTNDDVSAFTNFIIADGGLRIVGITYTVGDKSVTIKPPV